MRRFATLLLIGIAASIHAFGGESDDAAYLAKLDKRYPWEGVSAKEPSFFKVPSVRKNFMGLVPSKWRNAIKNEFQTGTVNVVVDGYLVVSACKPHRCPFKNYVAVVRLSDQGMYFVFYDAQENEDDALATHCFSTKETDLKALPATVKEELALRRGGGEEWPEEVRCTTRGLTFPSSGLATQAAEVRR